MPLWVGKTWMCSRCEWINSVLRKKCRNWLCNAPRPADVEAPKEAAHA